MSSAIRTFHRWVSMLFVITVAAIFITQGMGKATPQWVYYVPLAPLALLTVTGLYMFFLPYRTKARRAG